MQPWFSKKYASLSVLVLLTIALIYSCKKSDNDFEPAPVISYQQKIISIPVDVPMIPVRPDSTGGAIEEYSIQPLLPKGISSIRPMVLSVVRQVIHFLQPNSWLPLQVLVEELQTRCFFQ